MAIRAKTHASMHINTVQWEGTVTAADVSGLVDFYTAASAHAAKIDQVHVLERGVKLEGIDRDFLVSFKSRLVAALAAVQRQVYIRTAFVCRDASSMPVIAAWVAMSREDDGMFSDPRMVEDVDAACEWLGLTEDEARAVRESFRSS